MDAKELKPCPFCGADGEEVVDAAGFRNYYCTSCTCMLDSAFEHHATGRAAWNSRAALPSDAAQAPEGWKLVPTKITNEMIEAALAGHYGKRRVRESGGARGIDMTVDHTGYDGQDAMRRFWKGALAATPVAPAAAAPALFYNGDTKRDPELRASANAESIAAAQRDERAAFNKIAEKIHYPQCWDTAAYPTLASALVECVEWYDMRCGECDEGSRAIAPQATVKGDGSGEALPPFDAAVERAAVPQAGGAKLLSNIE